MFYSPLNGHINVLEHPFGGKAGFCAKYQEINHKLEFESVIPIRVIVMLEYVKGSNQHSIWPVMLGSEVKFYDRDPS